MKHVTLRIPKSNINLIHRLIKDGYGNSKSEVVRNILDEYIDLLYNSNTFMKVYHIKGKEHICINFTDKQVDMVGRLKEKGEFNSYSQIVSEAIRRLSPNILETYKEEEELKIKIPEGYDYIKGFNGNKPFKTARLEY